MGAEELAGGLGWPEGPSVLPDGRVAFVETYRSAISVWEPGAGSKQLASTGGGPNATCLGSDGNLYVTQNGGVVGPQRAEEQLPPSIQRVSAGGTAEILATEIDGVRLGAPNDLAFGPDGRLYFTDPGGQFDARERPDPGYVFALAPDGSGEVIAETGHSYPNGVAVERDGAVVWTESYTNAVRRWRVAEGVSEVAVTAHLPDGLAVATDGDLYVTTSDSGGIQILQPDGSPGAFVAVGVVLTNCAFAGSALFVTDGGHTGSSREPLYSGSLLSVEVAAEGMPLFQGALG